MTNSEPDLLPEELECLLHDEEAVENKPNDAVLGIVHDACIVSEPATKSQTTDLPPEALATVEHFTHDFSDQLATAFTERLQTTVSCEVVKISQPTFGDFLSESHQPTCFEVIRSESLQSPFFWEWSPQLLFPLLDRLLGGGQLPPTIARRPLTEIEQRLMRNVSEQVLELFTATWSPAFDLATRLDYIETNPQTTAPIPTDTPMWTANVLVNLGSHEGPLRIAVSQDALSNVADRLVAVGKKSRTHATVSVVLAESELGRDELLDMKVGDIVATEVGASDPAAIYIDDELAHHGVPGAQGGKKAIRIA